MRINHSLWIVPGIAATYIGTVVGAGFASGREVYQFFTLYGGRGTLGVILATLLLGTVGTKIFMLGVKLKPKSYRDLLELLLGKTFAPIADLILFLFFTTLIGVMLAGCGSIFETVGFGYWPGVVISGLFTVLTLFKGLNGIISVNLIVVPLMLVGSIGISIYAIPNRCVGPIAIGNGLNWMLAAFQYSAYNLILALPVLLSLAQRYPFPRSLKLGSWGGSLGLGLMSGFIHWSILSHLPHLQHSALPMVELAKLMGTWAFWGYIMVLWGEMITTLLANTYGVAQRLMVLTGWPFRWWALISVVVGSFIAQLGFVNLIARFYPLYGFLSLILLFFIVCRKTPKQRSL